MNLGKILKTIFRELVFLGLDPREIPWLEVIGSGLMLATAYILLVIYSIYGGVL
jgi:hypothetical protein